MRILWLALALCAALVWARTSHAQAPPAEPPPTDRGEGAVPRGGAGAATRPAEPPEPGKAPQVVMPKVVHFEHAPYPPEAEKAGLEADVILKITVDASGKVTSAEVVQPAGHGFDEAAAAAMLKFVFEPATRDGKPITVQINFKYQFKLTAAAPTEATPKVEPAKPTTGNLEGSVRIADSNTALAGAEVVVRAPDGTEQRILADAEGRFKLENLPPGRYHVRVLAEGFDPREADEEVAAGEATEIIYRLAPKSEGLEVTVTGERPPREVTRRTLERREIARIPGTMGDALRSIQSMPGVARPPGLAGLLIVRGSAPQDTQTFVDGVGVLQIYHFFGLSSVVPTELLDRIDFYPGNFSAKYGRATGGLVDVALREPDTRCYGPYFAPTDKSGCYHGMAQADLIDTRFLLQGPLGPFDDWTFAVAGRRSWFDTWLKPVLEETGASVSSAPVYYDYQVIAETKPERDSRLSLRFYGSDDRLKLLVKDPAAQDPAFGGNLNIGTAFWRAQSLYQADLDPAVRLETTVAVGRDTLDFSIGNFFFVIDAWPVFARSEFGFKLTKGVKLNTGLDFFVAPFELSLRFPQPPRPGEPDPGPFAARPPLEAVQEGTVFRPAWYGEFELTPHRRLRIVPGARIDYARDSGHTDFSPRINARYDLIPAVPGDGPVPEQLRTTLKGGVGVFAQPPEFGETDEVYGTPGLRSNRAIHYSLGIEQEFTRQIELSVEGFYKDLSDLVAREPNVSGGFDYNNDGSGYVIGAEALLKYKPDKRFFGWLAYTLSRSVRRDSPNDPERLVEWDQTHNLIVLGSYRLGRGWEFGGRFRLVSGPLITPVLAGLPALYSADAGSYAPLQGELSSERLALFHQLDVRVDKRWQFRDWRLSAYLDILNIYNHQSVEGVAYNYNFSQRTNQTGLPFVPSIGLRGEF